MKLYLLTQSTSTGYDTFDSAVVRAPDEDTARQIHPRTGEIVKLSEWKNRLNYTWAKSPRDVDVELIGTCRGGKPGVICASFNAG